jgi:Iap family predicted aminopeptidase
MNKKISCLLVFLIFFVSALPVPAIAAPPSSLTPEEQAVLSLLDYDRVWNQLEYLSTFPEKVSGSPEETAAQEYVYQQFQQMGMDEINRETFDSQSWSHAGTRLKILSPQAEVIPVTTYGASYSIWGKDDGKPYGFGNQNQGKTLVAPLVNAGFGTASEFGALGDMSGKIALVHRDDDVTLWPNVVLEEAAIHNAAAVIFYGYYGAYPDVNSPQGEVVLPAGIKQDTIGGPLPAFSVSVNAANHLKELLINGEVILQVDGQADLISERFGQSTNVIATLRGSRYPDEYVVFSTHIDTWWTGTNDDLSGVAAVLEYARVFAEAKQSGLFNNQRTLVFAIFGSEEFGGPQETWFNWLVGSYEFVKSHPDMVDQTVIDLNLDMLSLKKSSGKYWIEQSPEANSFVSDALSDIGLNGTVGFYNPIYSWVDGWSFYAKGGTTSLNVLWVPNADETYHTQLDTMELADPEPLKISLDLYTLLALRADHALVLPIDLMSAIDWVAGILSADEGLAQSESVYFNEAFDSLNLLRQQVTQVNAYSEQLTTAYLQASQDERVIIEAQAAALNQALYAARKVFNVWSIGEGGTAGSWDVFLRTHQHAHDISSLDTALAALQRKNVANALKALEVIYSMEWGHRFSRSVYRTVLDSFTNADLYWGAEWDQQQEYIDVQGIYLGLRDGKMTVKSAITQLNEIRAGQLIPWLHEDLIVVESAWNQAAELLSTGLP